MPTTKRERIDPTQDWGQLRLRLKWPEQVAYELVRPPPARAGTRLWGGTAGERAKETGENERTIDRKADRFDRQGMLGLFPAQTRLAIVRLHADGWRVSTIARYLGTTRHTVYDTLERRVEEQFAGMPNRSHAPRQPATKTTLGVVNEIRKLQENPELGEWRVHAALLQMGIDMSPSTCGRIMARNRVLYGLDKPKHSPKQKKEMPFKANRRHQYWSLDIRYIEKHKLGGDKPVYAISAIENYSRALLASTISPTQDLVPVLMVLFEAFRAHGLPNAIVTDGGSVFRANRMVELCRTLGIRRERIDQGQPWENMVDMILHETHFSIMRRMADYHLERATSWEEMLAAHRRFVDDYNAQSHWAHRERQEGRHSPAEVPGTRSRVRGEGERIPRAGAASGLVRHPVHSPHRPVWLRQAE